MLRMTVERLKLQWASEDQAAIDAALNALLQHAHGRKTLWWLLQIGQVGQQPFSTDPYRTAFECGQLNVGQQVLARIISVSPEGYMNMMKEQADERTRRDSQLADTNARSGGNDYPLHTESDSDTYPGGTDT
jgi:hypothetical protein